MPTESPAAKKLKALRLRVTKLSVRALATELGYPSHNTYAYYENDFKEDLLPMDLVRKLAAVMIGRGDPPITEVEVWALGGAAPPFHHIVSPETYRPETRLFPPAVGMMPIDVPLVGTAVGGTTGDFQLNGQVVDYVRRPPGLIGNRGAFCLYITGTSMEPKFDHGELVYVDPNRPARNGDYVLVEMKPSMGGEPGPAYVKRLVAATPTKYRLLQFNPPNDKIELLRERVLRVSCIMKLNDLLGI